MRIKESVLAISLLAVGLGAFGNANARPLDISSVDVESKPFQFPVIGKEYRPGVDRGMGKYTNPSLYGTRKIVLTFDDGPHRTITPRILDVLKEYGAPATFFILGKNVSSKTKPIVDRMLAEGHLLASHDYNHLNKNGRDQLTYRNYLSKAINQIEDLEEEFGVEQKPMFYRFPYGAYGSGKLSYHHMNEMKKVSQSVYGENCINFAFWDLDTVDWLSDMSSTDIANNIKAQIDGGTAYRHKKINGKWRKSAYKITRPVGGGVVLMHDIHKKNIEAVRQILEYAKNNNVEIIPLDQVKGFKYDDKRCVRQ